MSPCQQGVIFVSAVYEAEQPVVRVHPLTGERSLLIGGFVSRIAGLSSAESPGAASWARSSSARSSCAYAARQSSLRPTPAPDNSKK